MREIGLKTIQQLAQEKSRTEGAVFSQRYKEFQRTYFDNPVAFAHDCIKWREGQRLTEYQEEILSSIGLGRFSVRGPHGLGKTALAAIAVHWFALTRDGLDWKCPTTASAWRQLQKYLWPEVHKWSRSLKWDKIGRKPYDLRAELQTLSLKLNTGEAFAMAADSAVMNEGAHADHMFYMFDESKAIPISVWDSAEGAFSGAGADTGRKAYALAISTPGEPAGRFYEIHQRKHGLEDWKVRHVTLDEAMKAGRISQEWAAQRKKLWGEKSAMYQNRVLGEFAVQDEHGIVPLAWIEAANERWFAWRESGHGGKLVAVGADIAAGGTNKTVFAPILEVGNQTCDFAVDELEEFDHKDEKDTATMNTAGRLVVKIGGEAKAIVDADGLGVGVFHRLKELGKKVIAFHNLPTKRTDKTGELRFKNCSSAAWYGVRELLSPDSTTKWALPPHDGLTQDLTTRHYTIRSDGVIEVESKDKMRDRLQIESTYSPDYGDSVAMGMFEMFTPPALGISAIPPKDAYVKNRFGR